MRDLSRILAAVAAAVATVPPAAAAQSRPACPATPAPPPAEFAGWAAPAAANAAASLDTVAPVAVGQAARLELAAADKVGFAHPPEKAAQPGGYAGLVALDVAKAGRYRVALGAPAWIDLVRDGGVEKSVAHGHGPACTGIRKIVDFDLQPGRHVLQLSGAPAAEVVLMVAGPR
ncbi:homogentisate 1,2-dioxygenase [Sphingomonas sp. DT-204]|uniref:homogentisate 1,2-dioxygenase n=1 Tax=Sphingomonas sp. DT-204 TaxID=3396166 RepID=UPI003F1A87F6